MTQRPLPLVVQQRDEGSSLSLPWEGAYTCQELIALELVQSDRKFTEAVALVKSRYGRGRNTGVESPLSVWTS